MDRFVIAATATVGVACGLLGAAVMLRRAERGGLPVDRPDERRLHQVATPRGGGIGIPAAGVAAGLLVASLSLAGTWTSPDLVVPLVFLWALPNGVMGWFDDHRPLPSRTKFAIQVIAAVAAGTQGLLLERLALPFVGTIELGAAAWPFTVLWLVWMANVYNFMDGLDALAAGCGLLFFVGFAALAADGCAGLAAVSAALAGAMAGFLRYNRPPARIFMGDGGSLFAGAALGGLAVALARPGCGAVPFAASVLLLGTFVWDATYTIAWRALHRQPMRPHKTHLFQRLVLAGCSRVRVTLLFIAATAASAIAAIAYEAVGETTQAALLTAAVGAGAVLVLLTRAAERRRLR